MAAASGPTVEARGLRGARLHDAVRVGELGLAGEIVRLRSDAAWIQVYEDTAGLAAGDPVVCLERPLQVELGPGLLGGIFDGVGRPLTRLEGAWIPRGVHEATLDRARRWTVRLQCREGQRVGPGDVLGTVEETRSVTHRVMVPPGVSGTVVSMTGGELGVDDVVARTDDGSEIRMLQAWPVRLPRPVRRREHDPVPFLTGQRVFDFLFPLQCGGCAVVPGGFGTGKTVVEQTLARHAQADVVIFVGCGERGNEMTEVLDELPRLSDPRGGLLMDRSILVVNTSNMPVAAREASIYTGMSMAEYYRDMGCSVALLVDSTSRWAEALREIASRLEEMPGEEGYPTYLGTRLAQLYERAGRAACLGSPERTGSVTMVAAVSPPGGDLSEPVTQVSVRVAGTLWALDPRLAHRRHYPAVDWTVSFSVYTRALDPWFESRVSPEWPALRRRLVDMLHAEAALEEAVALVGIDAMADEDRVALESARLMREVFLRQNVFLPTDATCPPGRQLAMARALLRYADGCQAALRRGVPLAEVLGHPARARLAHVVEVAEPDLEAWIVATLGDLVSEGGAPC